MNRLYLVLLSFTIFLGTIFQSLTMFRSGRMYSFGIGFWGPTARDGVWHQALSEQLKYSVPPENPGFSGNTLSNYHYFYDLLVAITSKITSISTLDLIYRVFPVIFSILFGIGTIFLAGKIFKSKTAVIVSLFFAYFGSSFGWVVEFVRERHFGGESAFWMNQPVSMNLNPPFAISMVLMIFLVFYLLNYRKTDSWLKTISLIIFVGLLSEFKVYAGIVLLISLGIVALYEFVKDKKTDLLLVFVPSLLIFIILLILKKTDATGSVIYKPFWFVNSMIDSPDRVGLVKFSQAREVYYASGNIIKYLIAQLVSLVIFLVGNLGTRLIGLLFIVINFKKVFKQRRYFFLTVLFLVSLTIPLFVIQKGNPWNTIQFSYYSLYIMAIFSGGIVAYLVGKYKNIFLYILLGILFIITPISSYTTFTFGYTNSPPAKLGKGEYEALKKLSNMERGVVLTPVFDKDLRSKFTSPFPLVVYDSNSYVSAFSSLPVYIEDESQQEILGSSYKDRVDKTNKFFANKMTGIEASEFLSKNNISYIYLPKIFNYSLTGYNELLGLMFENSEAGIYKLR